MGRGNVGRPSIEVCFLPGETIRSASEKAVMLANELGVIITWKFNGVKCIACPGDSPEKIVEFYFQKLRNEP